MSTINNNLHVLYPRKSAKDIFNDSASETAKKKGVLATLKDQSGHIDDETECCLALTVAALGCLIVSSACNH